MKISDKPGTDISLIMRYFAQEQGLSGKHLIKTTEEFLQKAIFNYRNNDWIDFIEKMSKHVKDRPLIELENIPITKNELQTISFLNNARLERLMFILLCCAKYRVSINNKTNGWVNTGLPDIFRMARINTTVKAKSELLATLKKKGLINTSKRSGNNNFQVTFMDMGNEPILLITDTRELAYEYLLYKGQHFIHCSSCGRLFKSNKQNNQKLCKSCSTYQSIGSKVIKCIDCGEEVVVDARNMTKDRCDKCQNNKDKELKKERNKRYYEKKKLN